MSGKLWFQGVPFGFAVVPDKAEQVILAEIIARRDRGMSWRSLAWLLNTKGVPCKKGGRTWYPSTVKGVYRSAKKRGVAS